MVEASVMNVMNRAPRFTGNKQAIKTTKQTISTKRTPRRTSASPIFNHSITTFKWIQVTPGKPAADPLVYHAAYHECKANKYSCAAVGPSLSLYSLFKEDVDSGGGGGGGGGEETGRRPPAS